jgi:hypothetical protein
MSGLVNIIHPYTFKLIEDTLQLGPCEEFKERDANLAGFVLAALDAGAKVLHHRHEHPTTFQGHLCDAAFHFDPLFEFLFDARIGSVVTTQSGIPMPDNRVEGVTEEDWKTLSEIYTSQSKLGSMVRDCGDVFFVGGVFENCLANAAFYFNKFYRREGQGMFYIPDLCVTFVAERKKDCEDILAKNGISGVSVQYAIDAMRRKS